MSSANGRPQGPGEWRLAWVVGLVFLMAGSVGFWLGRASTQWGSGPDSEPGLARRLVGVWLTASGGTLEFRSDGTFEDRFTTTTPELKDGALPADPAKIKMVQTKGQRVGQYKWVKADTIETKVIGQPERRSRIVIAGAELTILGEDGTVERLRRQN